MSDATRPGPTTKWAVREWADGRALSRPDRVVTEEPLEIRLSWPAAPIRRVAVTMRTPGHDFELAAGFLASERLLGPGDEIRSIRYCRDARLSEPQQYNVVTVELAASPRREPAGRFGVVSSACGVCGVESLDDVFPPDAAPIACPETIDARVISELPDRLRTHQPLFERTGAVHAAGVFDPLGDLVVAREDVGRHNAVDKVIGARVLGTVGYDEDALLCVSGRIGFDIISKAAVARVGAVIGVGAPSSLAVQLADRAGITVCGFTRRGRFVAYSWGERISAPVPVAPANRN